MLVVGAAAAFVFKKIINMPLDVVFGDKIVEGYDRVVTEWTLDDECVDFLEHLSTDGRVEDNNNVKLFLFLRDREIMDYAHLHTIVFAPREKSLWKGFLAAFEHPDMMYNLLRNAQEFRKVQGKFK